MDRQKFIKTCGLACLGATTIGTLLQSCVSTKSISVNMVGENLIVPISSFVKNKKHVDYLVASNESLKFPIYLFRFSEIKYSALLLRCTHQGNELNAYGDKLVCSAHGSEFDNKGKVVNGPATQSLRTFPVRIEGQNILISLKKT